MRSWKGPLKAAAKLYAVARLGNKIPSRNWKFVTVTECESDVNVIAYEVLEGKAAGKLYAGRRTRMAAGI